MAIRQLYPCFACRKVGYEVQVYLDGKDEVTGRTKYLNQDGTRHIHYSQQQPQQQQQRQSEAEKEGSFKIVSLQELQQQQQEMPRQRLEQQEQSSNNPLAPVSDESVQRGITAFSMMSELIGLTEKNQRVLSSLEGKMDRLINLIYATSSQAQAQIQQGKEDEQQQ